MNKRNKRSPSRDTSLPRSFDETRSPSRGLFTEETKKMLCFCAPCTCVPWMHAHKQRHFFGAPRRCDRHMLRLHIHTQPAVMSQCSKSKLIIAMWVIKVWNWSWGRHRLLPRISRGCVTRNDFRRDSVENAFGGPCGYAGTSLPGGSRGEESSGRAHGCTEYKWSDCSRWVLLFRALAECPWRNRARTRTPPNPRPFTSRGWWSHKLKWNKHTLTISLVVVVVVVSLHEFVESLNVFLNLWTFSWTYKHCSWFFRCFPTSLYVS